MLPKWQLYLTLLTVHCNLCKRGHWCICVLEYCFWNTFSTNCPHSLSLSLQTLLFDLRKTRPAEITSTCDCRLWHKAQHHTTATTNNTLTTTITLNSWYHSLTDLLYDLFMIIRSLYTAIKIILGTVCDLAMKARVSRLMIVKLGELTSRIICWKHFSSFTSLWWHI